MDVLEAFKEVIGLSREEVAMFLLRRFGLEESARTRIRGPGVDTPWEAFAAVRAPIYAKMLENPEVLSKEQWPRNVALLEEARRTGCKVGLATVAWSSRTLPPAWKPPGGRDVVHRRGHALHPGGSTRGASWRSAGSWTTRRRFRPPSGG